MNNKHELSLSSVDGDLAKCGAVMYDVEIYSAIPEDGVVRDPNLSYCGGWSDYEGMGVSVITAYDFVECQWLVFMSDNINTLRTLFNSRQIIMGFNNGRFDDNVLIANGIDIPASKSYDLWQQIVHTQPPGHRSGYALSKMLEANMIPAKTGHGSDAPRQAQEGRWGELITYCLGDTHKQVQLLRMACAGTMKNPHNGEYMKVKLPWETVDIEMDGIF